MRPDEKAFKKLLPEISAELFTLKLSAEVFYSRAVFVKISRKTSEAEPLFR